MQDLEETLQQALELGESEEWEAMATLLHEALESHPDNAEFLCWAGIAEREMGEEGIAKKTSSALAWRRPGGAP